MSFTRVATSKSIALDYFPLETVQVLYETFFRITNSSGNNCIY